MQEQRFGSWCPLMDKVVYLNCGDCRFESPRSLYLVDMSMLIIIFIQLIEKAPRMLKFEILQRQ